MLPRASTRAGRAMDRPARPVRPALPTPQSICLSIVAIGAFVSHSHTSLRDGPRSTPGPFFFADAKVFTPVKLASMPAAQISGWEKCDKTKDPTAPACRCPCDSTLVTVTQQYPGHHKCIDPENLGGSSGDQQASCPEEAFSLHGSSGLKCLLDPAQNATAAIPYRVFTTAPVPGADLAADGAEKFAAAWKARRCECASQCAEDTSCGYFTFSTKETNPLALYASGGDCALFRPGECAQDVAHALDADGKLATTFRKTASAKSGNGGASAKRCAKLGWALTDTVRPASVCAAAGVCNAKLHADILPSGMCSRSCSGDVSFGKCRCFKISRDSP